MRGALIGCGFFGQIQAEAWSRMPEADIVASCDPDIQRARVVSSNAFTDAEQLLDAVELDFIDIATRPDSHLRLVQLAVERGIPVICQKPLAPSIEEARAIVKLAADSGITVMVHENWRWQPWFREAHRLICDGAIGQPICYHFRLRQRDGGGSNPYPNQQYFREMPRLLIHETLIHPIDTSRYFFGDVTSVHARIRRLNPIMAGEDRAVLTLAHRSEIDGVIDGHRFADPDPAGPAMGETVIDGEAGVLRINAPGEITLDGKRVYAPPPGLPGYKGDSVRAVQLHFLECLRNGTPMESSAANYWNTVAIVEAAYVSAASGQTVVVG